MDRLESYRKVIKQVLQDYAVQGLETDSSGIERVVVVDEVADQYLLLNLGWWQGKRVTGATIHLRLRNGKIYVEEDWTEEGVVEDLLRSGIQRDEIVLAFQPPEVREHTEFALV
jgi:hypothetical protein